MKRTAVLTLLAFVAIFTASAQEAAPLSKLHMQAGALFPFYVSKPYNRFDRIPSAFRLQCGANMGKGELHLAAAFFSFNSDSLPSFSSSLFTLGYSRNIGLSARTWLKPGIAFGNNYQQFRNITIDRNHRNESELLLEASLHVQTAFYKKLHLLAGAVYQRTMFRHRFDVMSGHLALVYYFNTPPLLKKLID